MCLCEGSLCPMGAYETFFHFQKYAFLHDLVYIKVLILEIA